MAKQLSPTLAQIIRDKVEGEDCSIYEQYSGRGMYKAQCFGIVVNRHARATILSIFMDIIFDGIDGNYGDELLEEIRSHRWNMREDNMGLDQIYYFPNIQWPEEEYEDGVEDEEQLDEEGE